MRGSRAHIAGIGVSGSSPTELRAHAIAAATKALLDAGVRYTDVDQSIVCFDEKARIFPEWLSIFGTTGTAIAQVDNQSGLFTAAQFVRSGQRNCTLLIGTDGDALAVALILVSDPFLTSHAYLKDAAIHINASSQVSIIHSSTSTQTSTSAATIKAVHNALWNATLSPKDIQLVASSEELKFKDGSGLSEFSKKQRQEQLQSLGQVAGSTGLASLCGLVWQLRGWAHTSSSINVKTCLQNTLSKDGTSTVFVLSRSDGKEAPKWTDIEHLRDGRERLGYNPALEMRQISHEDVEAVRADRAFTEGAEVKRLQLSVKGGDRAALARL